MKILLVHNIISPYKVFLCNEIAKLIDNFSVIFIAETEKIREWRTNFSEINFHFSLLFPQKRIEDISLIELTRKLLKNLRSENPDILIIDGYSHIGFWIAMLWGKFNNKKLVLWSSTTEQDKKRFFLKELFKKFFIKQFHYANVYGTKSKNYLEKLGFESDKIFIMGNVTDNNFYSENCYNFRREKDNIIKEFNLLPNNFIFVGRFAPEKNIFTLLQAYKEAEIERYNWGLILVGGGPINEGIKNYIVKNNLKKVFLPGFLDKKELCKFYAVSDVLVLPSLSETWGLVVNEAMSCGLAIIVSLNCGCYPDLVKDGVNGFSFNPHNKEELKNIMLSIVKGGYNLENLKRNSLKIINDFTLESAAKIVKKTIDLLSIK